jgi:D-alanyl-lipoteichoic acid acyltransferase DltB (MBOAT superfamily)
VLFNSAEFALFFPVVVFLYFAVQSRHRWALLLAASCVFYMAAIPAYILILAFTIGTDYVAGLLIERARGRWRAVWLAASVAANLGVLFFFKYYDFAVGSAGPLARMLGMPVPSPLNLILPIGLSFHTFQALSYTIEVYRGRYPAERHLGIFALYVMFFPQLVAGPIERPAHLLPQFREDHRFDPAKARDGLRLMAWGLLKKVVIADRLAIITNQVFLAPTTYAGPHLTLATLAFAYQIYCDFSGYTDIARGSARVIGFELRRNFNSPYAAASVQEFWRRWHMSLSTWFRDYVYIPLGGSRQGDARRDRNVIVTFLASALWHGANWTFLVWGATRR